MPTNESETISTDSESLVLTEEELLLELARSIVRKPEKVSVDVARGKAVTLLTLTVDPDDRGHVIGRNRQTLNAIIHLFGKSAYLDGRKVIIHLDGQEPRENTYRKKNGGGNHRRNNHRRDDRDYRGDPPREYRRPS